MVFEYPLVIYFDITDNDSNISLQKFVQTQEVYNWSNERGSSGVLYVNRSLSICIKLIVYPVSGDDTITDTLTQKYENEVRLQSISSDVGFAPTIYRHFQTQITINEIRYDVYVIVMDYLNPTEWRNIPTNEVTNEIISTFVTKTKLYNDVDPYNHFYQKISEEDVMKIVMIDYGNVKECKEQKPKLSIDSCIEKMWSKFKNGGTKPKRNKYKSHKKYSLRKKNKKTIKIFNKYK
jgi:hypothetical protein